MLELNNVGKGGPRRHLNIVFTSGYGVYKVQKVYGNTVL